VLPQPAAAQNTPLPRLVRERAGMNTYTRASAISHVSLSDAHLRSRRARENPASHRSKPLVNFEKETTACHVA
jgi:hypothetical protein